MTTDRIDLVAASIPPNSLYLTLNFSGGQSALSLIPESPSIVLKHGTLKHTVSIAKLEDRECVADFLEINPLTAKKLGLTPNRRYEINYSAANRTLTLTSSPVSLANGVILSSPKLGMGTVSIGYELLARLGIPERRGFPLRLQLGSQKFNLRLFVPTNLDENRLTLSSYWAKKLQLVSGHSYSLRYDQRTSTIAIVARSG
ncbi:hypothetical protein ACFPVX_12160 [Cohnella faecalis]|uniref:Uncharacterized protein n=1 Tax=Cohnella faecalis TaxID=2315694 RepID=A0A398CM77_9BACL|nr:hypothetical protein [Cohnella faecalis]RIE03360.1 hypothetical protein D3H35_11815 [Cohnella faecalis]